MVGSSTCALPTLPQSQASLATIMAAMTTQKGSNYGMQLDQNYGSITANFGKWGRLDIPKGVSTGRD
jgi:hypothetical protein